MTTMPVLNCLLRLRHIGLAWALDGDDVLNRDLRAIASEESAGHWRRDQRRRDSEDEEVWHLGRD